MGDFFAAPIEGISRATERFEHHAASIARGQIDIDAAAGMIESERMVEANVAVLRAQDEMLGTILDEWA